MRWAYYPTTSFPYFGAKSFSHVDYQNSAKSLRGAVDLENKVMDYN